MPNMYMNAFKKFYGVVPQGLLHVGAHEAEEAEEHLKYNMSGNERIVWVEAQSEKVKLLREKLDPEKNLVLLLGSTRLFRRIRCTSFWLWMFKVPNLKF